MAESNYIAAAIQFEPVLKDLAGNREKLLHLTEQASRNGAKLIVLPEMATTGYCFYDRAEIAPYLEPIPGPTTRQFASLAKRYGTHIVLGMGERDEASGAFYNAAVLVRPDGQVDKMRKIHPYVSDTRWAKDGDLGFPVWDTPLGRLAAIICMDATFFESSRIPSLAGADVICMPTNWVEERAPAMDWFTRAIENNVYFIAADRYGEERGVQFSGGSCIIGPDGDLLSVLDTGDGIVEAEVDLQRARRHKGGPGGRSGRRPELYADLSLNPLQWEMREARDLYSHRPLPDGRAFSIAVLQPREIPEQPGHAGEMYADLISMAGGQAKGPLKLVVLPELSLVCDLDSAAERAEPISGWTSGWAEDLAEQLGIFLVISIPELAGDERYVTGVLIGPDGIVGCARRAHMATARNAWAAQGEHPFQTWDTPLGRLGILSGEDSVFPEPGRCLAIRGADIICVPAALAGPAPIDLPPTEVPLAEEIREVPDRAYWHLWRVRAAENNVYMAFANRSDADCMGWSGIFGPNLFQFPRQEALIDGRRAEHVWARVNTRDYLSAQAPNAVRFKPMIRMRKPTYYDGLFSEGSAE